MKLFIEKDHQGAFNVIYERYSKRLLGYFIKMFNGDLPQAQDFVQDLFIRIVEKKHLFDTEKKLYSWIFTIASNMCKTSFRKPSAISLTSWKETLEQEVPDIDKLVFKKILRAEIYQLEHHHKVVFILRHLERFSLEEIATITETNIGTVKSRLFYATKTISKKIKNYAPEDWVDTFKLG
ncbi:MAG: sigma-70 family RNA polymerase sigma factor [Flavobacteriales bacterium]|nr:sigma-70 family RNA polymerase sigma factor [Flavobacteriales bacterium]MCB9196380.1 sigma-70 family RNA polymerase sigma factor [Flavobacteriales bacterium]MCB9198537.1 sigma-70 family RNA polymerase sigma factor [Flavobacteriales bacterium]